MNINLIIISVQIAGFKSNLGFEMINLNGLKHTDLFKLIKIHLN